MTPLRTKDRVFLLTAVPAAAVAAYGCGASTPHAGRTGWRLEALPLSRSKASTARWLSQAGNSHPRRESSKKKSRRFRRRRM